MSDGASAPLSSGESAARRRIRSFSLRGSRLGDRHVQLMAERGAEFVISAPAGEGVSTIAADARVDLAAAFGREAPLIVEVGPGSGEQLVASASAHPERNYLGLEAWAPGVARCVHTAARAGVANVRFMQLDAAQALPVLFSGVNSANFPAAEVWSFFPDPWRKRKHRKRRLISPSFAATVAGVLEAGGIWRLATDWDNYAWQMRDVLVESPWFELQAADEDTETAAADLMVDDLGLYSGGFASRWEERVVTRFEERGIEAGRRVYDLLAVRGAEPVDFAHVPEDPWIAAAKRGETVAADMPGLERPPSSRAGWLKAQSQQGQ